MGIKGDGNEKTLDMLWNEYFAEKCAVIETEEERRLAKEAVELHKMANELLTEEQSDAIDKYIDTLCAIHSSFSKKAFCMGCEVAASFLLETSFPESGREANSK